MNGLKKSGTFTQWKIAQSLKNGIMKLTGKWMVVENILSETAQTQRDKYGRHSPISGCYLQVIVK